MELTGLLYILAGTVIVSSIVLVILHTVLHIIAAIKRAIHYVGDEKICKGSCEVAIDNVNLYANMIERGCYNCPRNNGSCNGKCCMRRPNCR